MTALFATSKVYLTADKGFDLRLNEGRGVVLF